MASINKKDLRILKSGELVMAKKDLCLYYELDTVSPGDSRLQMVEVEQGDLMLVVEDYRTVNFQKSNEKAFKSASNTAKIIKLLYGKYVAWFTKDNHELISKYIAPAKSPEI